jgi:hypothetical protein
VVEVQAEEVGPSLRLATAKPERATNGKPSGQFNDAPPFSAPSGSEAGADATRPGLAHHQEARPADAHRIPPDLAGDPDTPVDPPPFALHPLHGL